MPERLILIGGGGHARVVADAVSSMEGRFELLGFVDPDPVAMIDGLEHLGDEAAVGVHQPALGILSVGGLTVSDARSKIVERLAPSLSGWASVIHSTAWVSRGAQVEEGAVLMAGVIVQTGAQIGRHAIVNTRAVVEHDVELGAFAVLAPGVVVGGGAKIGEGSVIGLGASVRDHIVIGPGSMVGMGSVVVDDVGPGTIVMGHPASVGDRP